MFIPQIALDSWLGLTTSGFAQLSNVETRRSSHLWDRYQNPIPHMCLPNINPSKSSWKIAQKSQVFIIKVQKKNCLHRKIILKKQNKSSP
jgi:hypothetical protein